MLVANMHQMNFSMRILWYAFLLHVHVASFQGPKRRRRKGLVSAICACRCMPERLKLILLFGPRNEAYVCGIPSMFVRLQCNIIHTGCQAQK